MTSTGKTPSVPTQLATPTDLKPGEVKAVTAAVNRLIADGFALYVKTKNFHWHVASSHFRDYHLLLDEQADAIFNSIDVLAERIRRIGGTTIRSVSHIGQLDRKSTRLNSSHGYISYAVFCLKKKKSGHA